MARYMVLVEEFEGFQFYGSWDDYEAVKLWLKNRIEDITRHAPATGVVYLVALDSRGGPKLYDVYGEDPNIETFYASDAVDA